MCVVYLESKQVLLCFTVSTTHRSQSKWMFVLVLLCDMHLWFLCSVGSSLYSLILVTLFKALLIYDSVIFFFFFTACSQKMAQDYDVCYMKAQDDVCAMKNWCVSFNQCNHCHIDLSPVIVTLTYHMWLSQWLTYHLWLLQYTVVVKTLWSSFYNCVGFMQESFMRVEFSELWNCTLFNEFIYILL